VTLVLQSVGRVSGAPYVLSAALRCLPLVCLGDTSMMVFGLFYLRYKAGCSIKIAARHIWYDRFDSHLDRAWDEVASWLQIKSTVETRSSEEYHRLRCPRSTGSGQHHSGGTGPSCLEEERDDNHSMSGNGEGPDATHIHDENDDEMSSQDMSLLRPDLIIGSPVESRFYPGSAIDRTWRYGIVAFLIGALPQVIKVFAMQGIPFTKILISIFVVAFTVPEIFRVGAGLVDARELHPLPTVSRAQTKLQEWNCTILQICVGMSLPPYYPSFQLDPRDGETWSRDGCIFFTSFALGVAVSVFLKTIWMHIRRVFALSDRYEQLPRSISLVERAWEYHSKTCVVLGKAFPYSSTTRLHRNVGIAYIPVTLLIFATLHFSSWDGGLLLLSSQDVNLVLYLLNVFVVVVPQMFILFLSPPIFTTLALGLIFELFFIGSCSCYPRRITGVTGSLGEFSSGYILLLTLYTYFLYYAILNDWDATGTYKPSWTEYLG
jgi:hypothetical protein